MKRKNILWGFALLIVAMICCWACSSCSDDKEKEEPNNNPLLGAWEYVHNPQILAVLEQRLVQELQENNALTTENIQILTKIKEIISTSKFVVQLNADGTTRLYAYNGNGVGPFVSGTWVQTDEALLLGAANLTLAVTDIQYDGTTLQCKICDLPLSFTKVKI